MTITSHAQNFEDVLLWRALGHVGQGTYLDIGAQDPVHDSVSLAFYQAGWRGTHVEPTPFYAARLREARPDETVIEAAVSETAGPLEIYEIPDTGLSTGKAEIASEHVKQGYEAKKIIVPTVRLDQLLEITGEVHWLKIDVEGMEADVLASWADSPVRPWLLVIESTVPNTQLPTEHLWKGEVAKRGYRELYFDGLSRYFVHENHEELASHFSTPPNIFDGFTIPSSHFSARELVNIHEAEIEGIRSTSETREANLEQLLAQSNAEIRVKQGEADRWWGEANAATMALAAAEAERSHALDREKQAYERLFAAEQEHRVALELQWQERKATEAELKSVEAALAQRQTDLARLEERLGLMQESASQQQGLLRVTQEQTRANAEKLFDAQNQISNLRTALALAQNDAEKASAELKEQANEIGFIFGQANRLISAVVDEPQSGWQRLGRALGLASPSRALMALSAWNATQQRTRQLSHSAGSQPSQANPVMQANQSGDRNPYLRADSLAELLSWGDVDFVRCAYVTVLGRRPDPEGEAYYLDRLRRGYSKMRLLRQLRKSPEARRHDPGIAGFDRALKSAYWRELQMLNLPKTRPASEAPEQPVITSDLFSKISMIESRLDDIAAKLEAIRASNSFLEGAVLRSLDYDLGDEPSKNNVPQGDLFKRNLADAASKFGQPKQ